MSHTAYVRELEREVEYLRAKLTATEAALSAASRPAPTGGEVDLEQLAKATVADTESEFSIEWSDGAKTHAYVTILAALRRAQGGHG